MKKFLMLIVVALLSGVAFANDVFQTDATKVFKMAKEQNKMVFMVFSGSDWCGPCIALEKNVLSQKSFSQSLAKDYLFLEVDFPRKTKLSAALTAQNKSLASKYAVNAFPTLIVVNSNGEVILKQVGVTNSSVKAFLTWFNNAITKAKKEATVTDKTPTATVKTPTTTNKK